jgi:hypothetical protein
VNTTRTLTIIVLGLVLSTRALQGEDRWRYRVCTLGGVLVSVPTREGVAASDVKTIHQRPAVIQELEWWCPAISMTNGSSFTPAIRNVRSSQIEDTVILPWRLRRTGAGVGLTVSGVDISIQRNGFKLSKSVTF